MKLKVRDRIIDFSQKIMVMGIININDDSFSGDGTLDQQKAIKMAKDHVANGADIIDVGAESARTNRGPISIEEEIERLCPFIESFHSIEWSGKTEKPLLSINTWRPEVVEKILPLGVDLLNDIGALHSNDNAKLCAEHGAALLIMHSIGLPKEPHLGEKYEDIVAEVNRFFEEKIRVSESVGLHKEQIVLDPGIDFAKDRQDNLLLLKHLNSLKIHQRPLLVPVSRKTVIGDVLKIKEPQDRDAGTVACSVTSILRGASILRVHNVSATSKAIRTLEPLLK
ncbi:MAG: dihydropteroate synthase [Verrucomicrobiales bacterium]|jgi:dihydropteroate synthase|nr:dihydropteroate synthase [Verrucomicrobiales bacterium]